MKFVFIAAEKALYPVRLLCSVLEVSRSGAIDRPRELGRAVGLELLAKGAASIIERSRPA